MKYRRIHDQLNTHDPRQTELKLQEPPDTEVVSFVDAAVHLLATPAGAVGAGAILLLCAQLLWCESHDMKDTKNGD